jgi:ketosteroid isomerase-like protein
MGKDTRPADRFGWHASPRAARMASPAGDPPARRDPSRGPHATAARWECVPTSATGPRFAQASSSLAAKDLDWIAALYADNGRIMPPGAPEVEGREAIREAWRAMLAAPGPALTFGPNRIHTAAALDHAYELGTWKTGDADDGIPRDLLAKADRRAAQLGLDRGKYVRELIKQDVTAGARERPRRTFSSESFIGSLRLGRGPYTNRRIRALLRERLTSRRRSSPSSAARSVEPTMSVNRTVARTRSSETCVPRVPRNA